MKLKCIFINFVGNAAFARFGSKVLGVIGAPSLGMCGGVYVVKRNA